MSKSKDRLGPHTNLMLKVLANNGELRLKDWLKIFISQYPPPLEWFGIRLWRFGRNPPRRRVRTLVARGYVTRRALTEPQRMMYKITKNGLAYLKPK